MTGLSPQELDQLKKQAAARIGRGADRQDVLLEICQEAGMDWPQAETFLEDLEAGRRRTINRWRGVLLLLVSVTLLIEGTLAAGPLYELVFDVLEHLAERPVRAVTTLLISQLAPYWPLFLLWLVLNAASLVGLGSGLARLLHPD